MTIGMTDCFAETSQPRVESGAELADLELSLDRLKTMSIIVPRPWAGAMARE